MDHIKNIQIKIDLYYETHSTYADRLRKTYNCLMYVGIICGPLSGFINNISQSLDHQNIPIYYIISSLIAYISGIVIAIVKFGEFKELSSLHHNVAKKYYSLSNNITRQLNMINKKEIEIQCYIQWVEDTFDKLIKESPYIHINETANDFYVKDSCNDIYADAKMQYEIERFQRNFQHTKNEVTNHVPRVLVQ